MEAVLDRDFTGGDVGDHLGDEEGVVLGTLFGAVDGIVAGLFFEGVDAADTYAEDNADTVLVNGLEVHAAVLDSLHGGHEGILLVEVHLAGFLAVDIVGHLEVLDFAGKLRLKLRCVKMGDGAGTAHTFLQVFPRFGGGLTQRRQCAHAGYYHSFQFHK